MSHEDVEIVLVEDDPNDAELIVRSLRKQRLANHIVVLKDGAEALDFLFAKGRYNKRTISDTPKVVLLDIKLPKVDGIEVLRQIKSDARTRELPVVMLTSSTMEKDIEEAYALGANSFVTKPIQFEEFAKAVTELGLYWLLLNVPPG